MEAKIVEADPLVTITMKKSEAQTLRHVLGVMSSKDEPIAHAVKLGCDEPLTVTDAVYFVLDVVV